jgi:hypothetical protein
MTDKTEETKKEFSYEERVAEVKAGIKEKAEKRAASAMEEGKDLTTEYKHFNKWRQDAADVKKNIMDLGLTAEHAFFVVYDAFTDIIPSAIVNSKIAENARKASIHLEVGRLLGDSILNAKYEDSEFEKLVQEYNRIIEEENRNSIPPPPVIELPETDKTED